MFQIWVEKEELRATSVFLNINVEIKPLWRHLRSSVASCDRIIAKFEAFFFAKWRLLTAKCIERTPILCFLLDLQWTDMSITGADWT